MRLSVRSALLPVSIYGAVFGFSIFRFDNRIMQKLQKIYFFIITVFTFLFKATVLLIKLYNMEVNFVSIIYLVADVASTATLANYSFKFVLSENILSSVVDNLDYVDKCFDRIGVKVCHVKENVLCWMGFSLMLLFRIMISQVFLINIQHSGVQNEISTEHASVVGRAQKLLLNYSCSAIEFYFVLTLYAVMRRLTVFRHTVLRFNRLRNVAWSASVDHTCRRISISEKRMLFNTLRTIYGSLSNAYYNTKEFHIIFLRLILLKLLFFPSLYLIINPVSNCSALFYFCYILRIWIFDTLPLLLAIQVTHEICNVQTALINIYYDNCIDSVNNKIDKWMRLAANTDATFDCGYFTVDYNLLPIVVNYFSLFVFALLP